MHRNYFLFEKQIQFIQKKIIFSTIARCFTYRKDELIISLVSEEDLFLRIGLNSRTPYILLDKAHNLKYPHINFFPEINDKKIKNCSIIPYDKIVDFYIDDFKLECIFFGRNRNVNLMDVNNAIIGRFKKSPTKENQNSADSSDKILSPFNLVKFDRMNVNETLNSFILRRIGGFNKLLTKELCFRANINHTTILSEISSGQRHELLKSLDSILEELKHDNYFIYEGAQDIPILSLIELKHIPDSYVKEIYNDINTTWIHFIYLSQQKLNLQHALNRSREKIARRIKYLEETLRKVSDFKDLEEKKKLSELKGHLLQTFSSEIEKGIDQIKLPNIYSTEKEHISIQLNPKQSVQQNALRYFNKYKNIAEQKKRLRIKQDTYEDELKFWKKKYHDTEKIDNLKKAEKLEQILSQKQLIQREKTTKKSTSKVDITAFKRLLLKQEWEILIGKNAENNDLLTFKFARKHDIWLHAQGVPGSHVIIRLQDKNQKPPRDIIEQAASVAAYFSNAKNSSTVAVNYSEVRFVRKPRKSTAGTAIVSNAKTIFVEPKKYI